MTPAVSAAVHPSPSPLQPARGVRPQLHGLRGPAPRPSSQQGGSGHSSTACGPAAERRILGLPPQERRLASTLVEAGQGHLFCHWPPPGACQARTRPRLRWHAPVADAAAGMALQQRLTCGPPRLPSPPPSAGVRDAEKRALLRATADHVADAGAQLEPHRLGGLAGWLSGWAGCLAGWLAGWLGCLAVWLSGWAVWLAGCLAVWLAGLSGCLAGLSGCLAGWLAGLAVWLSGWAGWLAGRRHYCDPGQAQARTGCATMHDDLPPPCHHPALTACTVAPPPQALCRRRWPPSAPSSWRCTGTCAWTTTTGAPQAILRRPCAARRLCAAGCARPAAHAAPRGLQAA
jgi:hypothetical protein